MKSDKLIKLTDLFYQLLTNTITKYIHSKLKLLFHIPRKNPLKNSTPGIIKVT